MHVNDNGGDILISPRDGQIDFSKYSTVQLQDLRHTIDGRSHPQNLRNLLAELSKREAAGPDAIIFRDLHEFSVRFTPRDGIAGWIQGLLSHSPLSGHGVLRFEGAHLAIVGWRRDWVGIRKETEYRVSMTDVSDVEANASTVSFDARLQNGRKRIRCFIEDAPTKQAIVDRLPAASVSPLSASAAQWREFDGALKRTTPHAFVTGILLVLNVAIFLALTFAGSGFWSANFEMLTRWGANTTALTTDGQSWRLVSAMFLHAGFLHLLFNMWALWGVGRLTERLYGSALFVAIYGCAGAVASLASIAWSPFVVSVGASGAIFGVLGACLAFLVRGRTHIPRRIGWRLGLTTAIFILFNLIGGFVSEGIDNAAHVGGLVTGVVLGSLLARPLRDGERIALKLSRATAAVAFALITIASGFWQMHIMATDRPVPTRYWATHRWFLDGQMKALEKQAHLQAAATSGSISPSQFALNFESEVFMFWRDAYERLKNEPEPQDLELRDFAADVTDFVHRRNEWATALLDAAKEDRFESAQDASYYLESANLAAARLNRAELRALSGPSHALSHSRFVRLLRNLPTRLTWKCVSDDRGPMNGKTTDGLAARHSAGCDAQRAFVTEDYAALEAMLHPEGGKLESFDDGGTQLEGAIAGFQRIFEVSAPLPALSSLGMWRREFPSSDGPDLIEALLFRVGLGKPAATAMRKK